jgi:GGDEF domain-containing protein
VLFRSIQEKCKKNTFLDKQNQRTFNISFSYGLVLYDKNIDTLESLLIRSEMELKESKKKQAS